jgi:tight adherence protein B
MSIQMLSIVIAIMVFAAGLLVYLGIQAARAKAATPEMEERLERYGHVVETAVAVPQDRDSGSFVADRVERAVKGRSFADKTRMGISRADLRITVGEWILVRIGAAAVASLIGLVMGRTSPGLAVLFAILFAGIGWLLPQLYLSMRAKKRQKAFVNQLGDTISLMANSLRAGYSLLQTMELVSREAQEPMSTEFSRVVREVGLGISPNQALENLMRRIPSEDLDLLVSAIKIQHEVGGNLGQILDVIGETIRERVRIKGEIGVLTAQQSLSGYVISALPLILGAALFLINPDYMSQMFVWPFVCMPIGAALLMVLGFLAMRKVVAIEV